MGLAPMDVGGLLGPGPIEALGMPGAIELGGLVGPGPMELGGMAGLGPGALELGGMPGPGPIELGGMPGPGPIDGLGGKAGLICCCGCELGPMGLGGIIMLLLFC